MNKKIYLSLPKQINTLKMTKIISLTGDLGSGKSTVSNLLIKQLGYDYIYTGKIQREIADKHNMTTLELNKYAETHPEIDEEIDSTFKSLNSSTDLIVDSRLAWFFVPKSFKIFLKTNLMVSANRISSDYRRKSEKYASSSRNARATRIRRLGARSGPAVFWRTSPERLAGSSGVIPLRSRCFCCSR